MVSAREQRRQVPSLAASESLVAAASSSTVASHQAGAGDALGPTRSLEPLSSWILRHVHALVRHLQLHLVRCLASASPPRQEGALPCAGETCPPRT
eukprot:763837-Hanusia_phi.AAC.5